MKAMNKIIKSKNEIIFFENYCSMKLYNKKGEHISDTIFDIEDLKLLSKYRWHKSQTGYARTSINPKKQILMHRLIMKCKKWVDHKNLNRLDNRKNNLRPVTKSQNVINRALQKNNKSGFRGVYYRNKKHGEKIYGYWIGELTINGKVIYIKGSKNKDLVIEEIKKAQKKYFKEYVQSV